MTLIKSQLAHVAAAVAGAFVFTSGMAPTVKAQTAEPVSRAWKLDVAKSTFAAIPIDAHIMKWVPSGDGFKVTLYDFYARGRVHTEGTAIYGGTDYPVIGSRVPDATRAFSRIDERTHESILTVNGRVVGTATRMVTSDARTMIVWSTFGSSKSVSVYERP